MAYATELPSDYKRIEDHYSRRGMLWLWCCEILTKLPPFWWTYNHDIKLDGWRLEVMAGAWSYEEIQNERRWFPPMTPERTRTELRKIASGGYASTDLALMNETETDAPKVEECQPLSHSWELWTQDMRQWPAYVELHCALCGKRQWYIVSNAPAGWPEAPR